MNKNLLLNLALLGSRLCSGFLCLALVAFIGLFIHWHLDPEYYESAQISIRNGSVTLLEGGEGIPKTAPGPANPNHHSGAGLSATASQRMYHVNDLSPVSFYYTSLQILLSIVLGLFMAWEVTKILSSVRELRIFTTTNIKSFRSLGYLCLAMAAFNSIRILATDQHSSISFSIGFSLLAFMLAAFIMAEIFRIGQNLYEQDQLTI